MGAYPHGQTESAAFLVVTGLERPGLGRSIP